jgi:YniB-like protein
MDYHQARSAILAKRMAGSLLVFVGALFTLAGLLVYIHGSLDSGGPLLAQASNMLKRLVYGIYERTRLLDLVWRNAPVPNPSQPLALGNFGFLGAYATTFFGASLIRSANRLARRLAKLKEEIEDEVMRQSVSGTRKRTRADIESEVKVPNTPFWKEIHTLYVAPLIVGLILWLLSKL